MASKKAAFKHIVDKGTNFERLVDTEEAEESPAQPKKAKTKYKKSKPGMFVRWWNHVTYTFYCLVFRAGVAALFILLGLAAGTGQKVYNFFDNASHGTTVAEASHRVQVAEASTGNYVAETVAPEEAPIPTEHLMSPDEVRAYRSGYATRAPRALHEPVPTSPNSETRSRSEHD